MNELRQADCLNLMIKLPRSFGVFTEQHYSIHEVIVLTPTHSLVLERALFKQCVKDEEMFYPEYHTIQIELYLIFVFSDYFL